MIVIQSDQFNGRQIAQTVEHLTRNSGGPGSNPGLVGNYFSHPASLIITKNPDTLYDVQLSL